MHRLTIQYAEPSDPAAFDRQYFDQHVALCKPLPGLRAAAFSKPRVLGRGACPYLVAELDFDSEEAMKESMGSPEGRAAGKDIRNFATGGVTFVHFDVQQAS